MSKSVNIAIIGCGVVGSAFIHQLTNLKTSIKFNVVYLALSSQEAVFTEDYKPVDLTMRITTEIKPVLGLDELTKFLKGSNRPTILIDNTSNSEIANYYPKFIEKGISIATPNKKAFSSDLSIWKEIFDNSEKCGGLVYHEATVGAGLPIIGPLRDLIATGDKIEKIEGIFSEIVSAAKNLGYTEPDPRDDLNGLDVARKLTILARISGFEVESPNSFPVQSLIPKDLESIESVDEFLEKLPHYDSDIQKIKDEALAENKVLRFIGQVDFKANKIFVGVDKYDFGHPFASLKGSDNVVSIKTGRYPNPLIIQGAGAGAEVTAHGVLADALKIAERIAN